VAQPNQARYEKLLTLVDDEEKELDRILSAEQAKRLGQLVVQQRGADAFRDPKVIAALQLTPDQEVRVGAILEDSRRPMTGQVARPATALAREGAEQAQGREQLLAVLTQEQKAKWQELVGRPAQLRVLVREKDVLPPVLGAGVEAPGQILVNQLGLANGQGL